MIHHHFGRGHDGHHGFGGSRRWFGVKGLDSFDRTGNEINDPDLQRYLDTQYCVKCKRNCRLSSSICPCGEKQRIAAKEKYISNRKMAGRSDFFLR